MRYFSESKKTWFCQQKFWHLFKSTGLLTACTFMAKNVSHPALWWDKLIKRQPRLSGLLSDSDPVSRSLLRSLALPVWYTCTVAYQMRTRTGWGLLTSSFIHIFDHPESSLSGLTSWVGTSPNDHCWTVTFSDAGNVSLVLECIYSQLWGYRAILWSEII